MNLDKVAAASRRRLEIGHFFKTQIMLCRTHSA